MANRPTSRRGAARVEEPKPSAPPPDVRATLPPPPKVDPITARAVGRLREIADALETGQVNQGGCFLLGFDDGFHASEKSGAQCDRVLQVKVAYIGANSFEGESR
jgi:hypothetical protein